MTPLQAKPGRGGAREGAGRKREYFEPTKMQAYHLPVRLVEKLRTKARALGTSPSKLLVKMLERMKGDPQ